MNPDEIKPDDFQVCITILEARHLAWKNMDPVVCVQVDNQRKYTEAGGNTDSPYYNENFIFEFHLPFPILMEKTINLSVIHSAKIPLRVKELGRTTLDIGTVWHQPNHQFYHKWAVLLDPNDYLGGSKGYLKCDLSVIGKGEVVRVHPTHEDEEDDIEGNLLVAEGVKAERQRARYIVCVYRADHIPQYLHTKLHRKDKIDPYVEVSFAGLTGKTSMKRNNWEPVWNEQLVFNDAFPPLWKRIRFQIRDSDTIGHTVIATHLMNLAAISSDHQHHEFLPTFGPTFINLYGSSRRPRESEGWTAALGDGGAYRGRLLLALETVIQDFTPTDTQVHPARYNVALQSIPAVDEATLWELEPIALVGVVWSVSMLGTKLANETLLVEISVGNVGNTSVQNESSTENTGIRSRTPPRKSMKQHEDAAHCSVSYGLEKPVLIVSKTFPNLRHRMYLSNLLCRFTLRLGAELLWIREGEMKAEDVSIMPEAERIRQVLKRVEDTCKSFINLTASRRFTGDALGINLLDRERLRICRQRVEQLRFSIGIMEHSLDIGNYKYILEQLQAHLRRLQDLVEDPQHALPDVFLWLVTRKGKRVGFHRLPARELLFSIVPEERGLNCGRLHSVLLKSPGSSLLAPQLRTPPGRLEVALWIGHSRHIHACFKHLPQGFQSPSGFGSHNTFGGDPPPKIPPSIVYEESHLFICLAYIYQGRLVPGGDKTGFSDPFVRVIFGGHNRDTKVIAVTLSPTWDETLIFEQIRLCGDLQTVKVKPPTLIIEAIDRDKHGKMEHIGRTSIKPTVILGIESIVFPRMRWYPLLLEARITAEILAAFQLIELNETISGLPALDQTKKKLFGIPENIKPTLVPHRLEVLFWGMRELQKVDLMTIKKPRVLIECGNYEVTSTTGNCVNGNCNFKEPLQVVDLMLPIEAEYHPPLTIKVNDCRSFNRATYVGTHIDNSVGHFLLQPNTQEECDVLLNTIVFPQPCTKRATEMDADEKYLESSPLLMSATPTKAQKDKRSLWKRLCDCCRSENTNSRTDNIAQENYGHEDEQYDWWTKYYESKKQMDSEQQREQDMVYVSEMNRDFCKRKRLQTRKKATFKIYESELEYQPEFGGFQDMIRTFDIVRGKSSGNKLHNNNIVVGKFKGTVKVYRWPDSENRKLMGQDATGVLQNDSVRLILRLYVVRATGLPAHDFAGKSDPYLEVQIGDRVISDNKNYIPGQLDPVFGRCFELEIAFPRDHLLTVRVWDHDVAGKDDFLGETRIDLENRFYSRHRATCGISRKYDVRGYNCWRDAMTPRDILADLCQRHGVPGPNYYANNVVLGKFDEDDVDELIGDRAPRDEAPLSQDELALIVLQHWHQIPLVGFHLVPEHVETRSLYNFQKPAFEQGKLELWVDLFPLGEAPLPPAVDISPRKPVKYELRVVIWNTEDVLLEEDTFFGERMSDIYVKGFMVGKEDSQVTDVHYRSLTGEGNFNWRFVFRFAYLAADNKLVVTRKKLFHWEPFEQKQPCRLTLQVWDNDTFSADDILGSLILDLAKMPRGAKTSNQCDLNVISFDAPTINLFQIHRTKGWWPFYSIGTSENLPELSGKVEAEFFLLTEEEAEEHPVGLGREPPEPLEKPVRPDTSFLWFKSPWRSFKYIVWRRYKKCLCGSVCILFLILFIVAAVYAFPGYSIKILLGA